MESTSTVAADPHAPGHGHGGEHGHEGHTPHLAHHFDTLNQQYEADKFGMWLFLATEILFFSGLFCAYAVYRSNHPEIFEYGHYFLSKPLGALNTVVLLFSSLTMAWGVRCAQLGQRRGLMLCLAITIMCAFGFLGVKYIEYSTKWREGLLWGARYQPTAEALEEIEHHLAENSPPGTIHKAPPTPDNVQIFFGIYFCMTGLHGIHIIAGIGVLTWLFIRAARGQFADGYYTPVDLVGLYWHVVDLIWIYLFPLLYLIH
jgi:cytochrome c oxidase subunit 3